MQYRKGKYNLLSKIFKTFLDKHLTNEKEYGIMRHKQKKGGAKNARYLFNEQGNGRN
jgi:hypothetical protein